MWPMAALLPLLALCVALPVQGNPQETTPPATHVSGLTTYTVKLEEKITSPYGNTDDTWEFVLKAFDLPSGKKSRQHLFVIEPNDGSKAPRLRLASVRLRKNGKTVVDLAHPEERALRDALLALVRVPVDVPRSRIEKLESGRSSIQITGLRLDKAVPVTYEAKPQEGAEDKIDYRVVLDAERVVSDYGNYRVELNKLTQRLVFARDDLRFLGGRWNRTTTQAYAGRETTKETRIQVIEQSQVALTREQVRSLKQEYDLLLPVARAVLPGFVHDASAKKVTESLEKYKKRYGEGMLASAVASLEVALNARLPVLGGMVDPDKRAKGLMNKPAPEFQLESLDGKQVSLSQFRGDVILIEFWSLM